MPDLDANLPAAITTVLDAAPRDLGGFTVGRLLPAIKRRNVGPFIFFDHMGPATFAAGHGIDVRPHPHIGLATVTFLFEGAIEHRDSVGSRQVIRPGDVNWMNAGRGIVHSERTPADLRETGATLHGLQLWLALPRTHEASAPTFHHHPARTLPTVTQPGVQLRVLAGTAYGQTSPVAFPAPLFYVDVQLEAGAEIDLPSAYAERALYVVEGEVMAVGVTAVPRRMLAFTDGVAVRVRAIQAARLVLFGGAALDGPRHLYWNFVASEPALIEDAKRAWQEQTFPTVPGDDQEFIPLPT